MHPLGGPLSVIERSRWAAYLAAGPWTWPDEADTAAWTEANRLCDQRRPVAEPGATPVIAVSGDVGFTYLLSIGPAKARVWTRLSAATLAAGTRVVWHRAALGVSNSLPFALQTIVHHVEGLADLRSLGQSAIPAKRDAPDVTMPAALEGESFGLAFSLALASCALDVSVPPDLVALAAIDDHGNTLRVDGLRAKCAAVEDTLPAVRRVLVNPADAALVQSLLPTISVIPVGTIGEAISQAWPDFPKALALRAEDEFERARLIDSLCLLALAGRHSHWVWRPVATTAQLLLKLQVSPIQERKLRLVDAIARRNDNDLIQLTLQPEALLAFSEPARTATAAHLVQHAASGGYLEADAIALFERFSVPDADAFPEQLKLLGAWGRFLHSRGRKVEALDVQKRAAAAWIERQRYDEVSYPLDQWMRIAAELRDLTSFSEAVACFERHDRLNVLSTVGLGYVLTALEEAYEKLGRADDAARIRARVASARPSHA